MLRSPTLVKSCLTALCILCPTGLYADWPAFLGGQSRSASKQYDPPTTWSGKTGIAWQSRLPGHGQSSPVVIGDSIYTTAIQGPNKESNLVLCYDLESGDQRWSHESPSSLPVKNDIYTSRAAPTPVADSSGVYAFFESGNLVALTPEGQVRWQRDLISDYGKYEGRFGIGGSLAQLPTAVIVLADNEGPAYLAAIDKQTGKTIWKTDRTSRTAWSSPMVIHVDGNPQIVVSSAGSIDGYDPTDGKRLWTYDEVGGNTVASPSPAGEARFLVGASPGRNGESSEGARKSNLLMEITSTTEGYEPKVIWVNEKLTSSFGSPIAYAGHAYYTNRAGVCFCVDLNDGEIVQTARLNGSNWATPIGIGDNVYFFGKSGVTTVVKAGNIKEVVAENVLFGADSENDDSGFAGEIQYGVAALPDGFVVRTGERLFRIKK